MKRFLLLLISALIWSPTFAQNTLAPGLPALGASPTDAFHSFDFDHIDTQNGNVILDIPLYQIPQPGKLKLSFSIKANSAGWTESENCDTYGDCGAYYGLSMGSAPGTNQPLSPSVVIDQDLLPIGIAEEYWWDQDAGPNTNGDYYYGQWVQESDASLHSLAMDLSDTSGVRARSTDGSGFMELYGTGALATATLPWEPPPPAIYDKTGTSFTWNQQGTQETIEDTNGNTISRSVGDSITDSLGRTFADPTSNRFTSTTTGCPAPPATAQYQSLIGSYTWTPPAPHGSATYKFIFCYASIAVSTNFFQEPDAKSQCESPNWYCQDYSASHIALQSVVLPNNTAWQFIYDSAGGGAYGFGQVQKILLPTGGSISYEYVTQPQCSTGNIPAYTRKIQSRTVDDGLGNTYVWKYDIGNPLYAPYASTIHSPAVAQPSGGQASNDTVVSYSLSNTTCVFVETQEDTYQGPSTPGSSPIQTKKIAYLSAAAPHPDLGYLPATSFVLPQTKTTIIPGVGQSVTTIHYDNGFRAAVFEWESDPSNSPAWATAYGPPAEMPFGDVTSTTVTDFDGSTVLSNRTVTPLWTTSGMYSSLYYLNNLLSLPAITTLSGNGNSSETDYGYDDPTCSPSGAYGNQTSIGKYSNVTQSDLTTTTCFNGMGMPIKTVDANGNSAGAVKDQHAILYNYDATGLFVSSVQAPTTSGITHTDYYNFDPNTGSMLWHTDQNGNAPTGGVPDPKHTTMYTYDVMDRLVDVLFPPVPEGQPESKLCYTDLGGAICAQSGAPFSAYISTTASPDPPVTAVEQYDGLGRPIISALLSNPQGPQITQTVYDGAGRVMSTTNPYTSTTESTYDVTTFVRDALGREVSATRKVDGTSKTWTYDQIYSAYPGNGTLFTDEVGNSTANVVDALGHLKYVIEANQVPTSFSYDVLGNLTGVSQAGNSSQGEVARSRSFVYDSLSRLVCASNPESASAPCAASALSMYIRGTIGYSYDPNGNVLSSTDASGVTTSHSYDALNRLLSTWYTGDATGTPSSCYSYDGAAASNLIGRLAQEWTQKGSCSSVPSGGTTLTSRTGLTYDAMGRLRSYQQCVLGSCSAGNPFQIMQTFDLAGNPSKTIQLSVPNLFPQLELLRNYDGAGRLRSVQSSWSSNNTPGSSLWLYSVQSYSPAGPTAWSLGGNVLNIQKSYDSRQRPVTEVVTR